MAGAAGADACAAASFEAPGVDATPAVADVLEAKVPPSFLAPSTRSAAARHRFAPANCMCLAEVSRKVQQRKVKASSQSQASVVPPAKADLHVPPETRNLRKREKHSADLGVAQLSDRAPHSFAAGASLEPLPATQRSLAPAKRRAQRPSRHGEPEREPMESPCDYGAPGEGENCKPDIAEKFLATCRWELPPAIPTSSTIAPKMPNNYQICSRRQILAELGHVSDNFGMLRQQTIDQIWSFFDQSGQCGPHLVNC